MEAQIRSSDGRMLVKVTGEDIKTLFRNVAAVQEIFTGEPCGACGSTETRLQVRTVEENDFFERVCTNIGCRAKLEFGQHKKGGGLFPKRKDENGKWMPESGWFRYVKPAEAGR